MRQKYVFSAEQIEEQKQFKNDLENKKVDFVFEGSFEDGMNFLKNQKKSI